HGALPRLGSTLAIILLGLLACAGCAGTATTRATPSISLDAALGQDTVYVTTTIGTSISNPGFLVALDAETGPPRWSRSAAGTMGVPVAANGTVFMAADDGKVYAFDAATGKPRWTFQRTVGVGFNTGFDGYLALGNGLLYVDSDGGAVYALDPATGRQ